MLAHTIRYIQRKDVKIDYHNNNQTSTTKWSEKYTCQKLVKDQRKITMIHHLSRSFQLEFSGLEHTELPMIPTFLPLLFAAFHSISSHPNLQHFLSPLSLLRDHHYF